MSLPRRVLNAPAAIPSKPFLHYDEVIKNSGPADGIVRQTSIMQLTRMLEQLSNMSLYANEIVANLVNSSMNTTQRIAEITTKIESIKHNSAPLEEKLLDVNLSESMTYERFDWKSRPTLSSNLFTRESEDPSLLAAYEACNDAPDLGVMDAYRTDGQTCMKLYSYPEFFAEQWKLLMQKEFEEEKRRKKERRELKKKAKLARPTTVNKAAVQELQIKRYNSQGEVLTSDAPDPGADSSGRMRPVSVAVRPWDANPLGRPSWSSNSNLDDGGSAYGRASRGPVPLEQGRSSQSRLAGVGIAGIRGSPLNPSSAPAAPAPPPPPPPPPPPSMGGGPPSSAALLAGISGLSKKDPRERLLKEAGPRDTVSRGESFLSDIKGGQFTLKKVQAPVLTDAERRNKRAEGSDVAAILMRRAAMEMSDSENEDSGEDDEWD
ncbi:hypothetical protein HDU87_002537 [Geranomyces variabilis]|uniref:WASP family protein member n=1 Tax=Geranomyces variabilis TaxID=109894 RepID=A0AAD5XR54_9FUNG|nr:hypothetical protein HDU87_002537 [Geranomyces variabilis]